MFSQWISGWEQVNIKTWNLEDLCFKQLFIKFYIILTSSVIYKQKLKKKKNYRFFGEKLNKPVLIRNVPVPTYNALVASISLALSCRTLEWEATPIHEEN